MAASATRERHGEHAGADAAPRGRAPETARAPPQNLELQSLFAAGALRAQLQVGAADDPVEAEADRVADAVMSGAPCPLCQAGASPCPSCAAKALRKPLAGAGPTPMGTGNLGLGGGRALGAGERARFEPAFGMDLGRVRVHDDARAARGAQAIEARAFSVGEHLAFGPGEYQPHTPEGQRLLAHELAHVALGHGGVRRQGGGTCSEGAGVCEAPADTPAVSLPSDEPATRPHPDAFDPCAVNERELTNYDLLAELNHTNPIVASGRDAPRFLDYRNLQRRLQQEVARRVRIGHHWLATNPTTIPATLIQVGDSPDGTMLVVRIGSGLVSGAPTNYELAPVMTQGQFDGALERQRVARMRADEYRRQLIEISLAGASTSGVVGSGLTQTALDRALMDPFAIAATDQKYIGRMSEAAYPSRAATAWGWGLGDTNARSWVDSAGRTQNAAGTQENYPLMDYERLVGRPASILGMARVSVKASTQATQAARLSYFRQGMAEMLQSSTRSSMPTYIANDPQFAGAQPGQYDANRSTVLREAYLAINAEDVEPFRRLLRDPTVRETPQSAASLWNDTGGPQPGGPPRRGWRPLFEGEMREHPVRIGQTDYASPTALDQAHQAGQVSDAQYQAAQREVGERLARRVVSSGITATDLANLRTRRTSLAGLTDAQLSPLLTPEYLRSQRAGGGVAGELRAGGGAGVQGGVVSGVIAVITTSGVMLFDERDHPDWAWELGSTGGLGFGGGFVGGATEQVLASRGTQQIIESAAAGTASRLSPGAVTGLSRFGGGGVGALFVETVGMGLVEERPHTYAEWGARGTRSFALGGTSAVIGAEAGAGSIVLATALAGAAGGSIAPGVGTAIGFVVGLAVGGLVYALADYVVPGGRADWDAYEAGCRPAPPPSSSHRIYAGSCFEAATPVRLADGRELPIGEIAVGDVVLSWHERDACVQPRPVLAVHVGEPALMLGVATADGGWFAVTPPHKVRTADGWLAVADLRPGDRLVRWSGADLALVEVTGIEPLAPASRVVDLGVETTHTYFAGGVLAHNKNA
jgi:hypothetical protein